MADDQQVQAAARAFIYGYPLLYNLDEIQKFPDGTATIVDGAATAWNTFAHARELLGPETAFVTPNNDTLYSVAPIDLSGGPVRIDVPDTADRYYVLQCVDAWTNNFAYIGRRATGTTAGSFTFVPPGYDGSVDDGSVVIHAPSTILVIVGRIQVDGEADLPAVHALQDRFAITPVDPSAARVGIPSAAAGVADDLVWWDRLRVGLLAFPPPAGDAPFVAMLERLGLLHAESPFTEPDPSLAEVLRAGAVQGLAMIEQLASGNSEPGSWTSAKDFFNYNLDHLELGTIDSPEWKIGDRSKAAVTRAVAARAGLWGNHGYEAAYDLVYADADGELLDGSRTYEVTFNPPPPVDAFWSLTMYDVPRYYLVANPIDRYSLGDRSPGLQYAADGSVTIYLQAASPGPDKEANWLPTPPAGNFRPVLRSYQPGPSITDGTYPLPLIQRIDG